MYGPSQGGQTFHTKGHILKIFEAEGRTGWKGKTKKSATSADVPFFPLKIGKD